MMLLNIEDLTPIAVGEPVASRYGLVFCVQDFKRATYPGATNVYALNLSIYLRDFAEMLANLH